jgi:hypothetical protein
MRGFRAALLLVCLSASADAVTMIGVYGCADWIDPQKHDLAKTWLYGYVSGIDEVLYSDFEVMKIPVRDVLTRLGTTADLDTWVDGYCKANPTRDLADGGVAFMKQLAAQSK